MGKGTPSPDARRAAKLRSTIKAGGQIDDADRAWLDEYKPSRGGRKASGTPPGAPPDAAAFEPPAEVAAEFQAPEEAMPPAPETPRVRPRDADRKGKAAGKTDWRSKYREGSAEGEREATCLQAAGLWIAGILRMNAAIVAAGKEPMIPSALIAEIREGGALALGPIGKAAVLCADKIIPADLAIGPEPLVIGASTLVAGQAWWVTRKVKPKAKAARSPEVETRAADPEPAPAPNGSNGASTSAPIVAIVRPIKIDDETRY